jgi:hypothetical protein
MIRGLLLLLACSLLQSGLAASSPIADPPRNSPRRVYVLDVRHLKRLDLAKPENAAEVWDTMHALAALQGIVNRETPQLYILYCAEFGVETDQFWLDWLRGEDGWLKESEVVQLTSLEEAVKLFRASLKGAVIYDGSVPATSNLASTAAGSCPHLGL